MVQENIGEGTPQKVTFEDVYLKDEIKEETVEEVTQISSIPTLLPYFLGGGILGYFLKKGF